MSDQSANQDSPGVPENDMRDRISLRLSEGAQEALREIKETYGLASDAEAIRIALGTERRMAEAFRKSEHILIADADNSNVRELVFNHWSLAKRDKI